MAFPWFTLITCILVIILIIVATFAIIYFEARQNCYTYPSPWCLASWSCVNTTGAYNPVQSFINAVNACKQDGSGQPSQQCVCLWSEFYSPDNGSCQP